ncbi:M48 family metalloprotease [Micromonospora sp. WMMD1082]|uniref:M48 family metalloprotease n=1 Tax=Micromonospora sp. WMMD1082 TaxID=3016104 RepID=UPI002417C0A1|nr:M48 family metalloprotease [Micromonospora sp. WMMD1082]MDG4798416.1 M48 family metalloprotease [Micromonospora sp. WMMD1082]
MTAPWRAGRPADTGFLLLPLVALMFSTAVLLATLFSASLLVRPGCDLGRVFQHPCTNMVNTFQFTFNLVIVPGAVLFLWLSRWHRRRTRPLDRAVFPAAAEVIDEVLASVRLPREVPVVLGPRLGRRAFTGGTGAKPYVALGPELLTLPAKGAAGREVFAAVLRHELAHVQNNDLLRLQLASSVRISTRAAALLTALLLLAQLRWAEQPPAVGVVAGVVLRTVVIVVVAELVVRAFLRAREHEADLRAAGDDPSGLRSALHRARQHTSGLRERLLARHPATARRLANLDDSSLVLALPAGQVLAAGLFAAVTLSNAQLLVHVLLAAEVLEPPEAATQPWVAVLILAVAVSPVAVFLAVGSWRDARGRSLAGHPARPWLAGSLFGVGLIAGEQLAPYPGLLYEVIPPTTPLLSGLLAYAAAAVLLCWWLTALVDPSRPPGRWERVALLPAATAVGVGALLIVWEFCGWLIAQRLNCVEQLLDCGPLDVPGILIEVLVQPWAPVPLALATIASLAAAVRRYATEAGARRTVVVPTTVVVVTGVALVTLLPRLPVSDALTAGHWPGPDQQLAGTGLALALRIALLVAVTLAALLPRRVAGAVAAAGALVVLAAGLVLLLAGLTDARPVDGERIGVEAGRYLGAAFGLVLPAILAVLGVRRLGRLRRGIAAPPPGPLPQRVGDAMDGGPGRVSRAEPA